VPSSFPVEVMRSRHSPRRGKGGENEAPFFIPVYSVKVRFCSQDRDQMANPLDFGGLLLKEISSAKKRIAPSLAYPGDGGGSSCWTKVVTPLFSRSSWEASIMVELIPILAHPLL